VSIDLLAPRPGGLAFRAFAPWPAGILLQFISAVQIGRICGGIEMGADAVAVDGDAVFAVFLDEIFNERNLLTLELSLRTFRIIPPEANGFLTTLI
jgi:hypothetical protein